MITAQTTEVQQFLRDYCLLQTMQTDKVMCTICDENEADKYGLCSECLTKFRLKPKGEDLVLTPPIPELGTYDPRELQSSLAEILEEEKEDEAFDEDDDEVDDPDFEDEDDFDLDFDEDFDEEDEEDDEDEDWEDDEEEDEDEDEDWEEE